jgi:hypothetical protein
MPAQAVMVWIEDGTGTITRGHVDAASAQGACVRLPGRPGFGEGDEVAVRICFEMGAPTVATRARVGGLRDAGDVVLCDLEWTAPADSDFEAWPAHAA